MLNSGQAQPRLVLPKHGSLDGEPAAQMMHHMAMQQAAGFNWRGEPRGFPIAPTSKKNEATHRKAPTTRIEALARAAFGK